jgi:DNA relaxase NicK
LETAAKLVDAGVDYLRLTTQDRAARNSFMRFYRRVAEFDYQLGYEEQKGGAFGFYGMRTRHALFGDKKEWSMLQVSGYESRSAWMLAQEGTQATRVDLQLTIFVGEENVERTIRAAYESACDHVRAKSRPIDVKLIEHRRRAQTLYLGKRASDIFCRVYDKFEESGREEYRGCVRYEIEFKGRMSKALWQALVLHETNLRASLEMVIAMYSERGVTVPCSDLDNQDIVHLKPSPTSLDGTVAWLSKQVAPTVKRLTAEFGYITPFRILFEQALTDLRIHRIMRTLAVVWGS